MKYICAFDAKNLTLYTRKIHDVHLLLSIKSNKKKSPGVFGRSELVRNILKYIFEKAGLIFWIHMFAKETSTIIFVKPVQPFIQVPLLQ